MTNSLISPELLDQSILYARFAAAAYNSQDVKHVKEFAKATNEQRFDEKTTDTQARVCILDGNLVLAFRGTEGKFSDWMSDLKGKLVKNTDGSGAVVSPGRIHQGFKTAADSVVAAVTKYILNLSDGPQTKLYVCGHSLGGALSLIVADRLAKTKHKNMPTVAGVFTYGSPRVGDNEYVTAFRQTPLTPITHMWVDSQDPVARVAPHSYQYRHAVSKQRTFDKFGDIRWTDLDLLGSSEDEDSFVSNLVGTFSRLKNAIQNFDASKHSIESSYLKNLLNAKSKATPTG